MEPNITTTVRLGAYTSLAGAITMLVGAALWATSGTDLWHALDNDDMVGYLRATAEVKQLLVANLSFWILGVLLLGTAGTALVRLCRQRPATAQFAQVCFGTAVPLAVISFIAMLSLVIQIGPDASATSVQTAKVVGWIGARADDLATALIVGLGPFFIALSGREEWMPKWLVRWGYLAGAAGLISLLVLYTSTMAAYGFVIIPIGIGWMLAVGIVLFRRSRVSKHD